MSSTVKFSIIAVFFCIALLSRIFCRTKTAKRGHAFLVLGMFFTLLADYFLILANDHAAGVFVFCFAHVAYILRVLPPEKFSKQTGGIKKGWFVMPPVCFVLAAIIFRPQPLIVLGIIYAALFCANIAVNIKYAPLLPKPNRVLILSGLLLFALCDVNVLLFNLPRFVPGFLPEKISQFAQGLIWLFYVPGQFLLAISAIDFHSGRRRTQFAPT